MQRARRLASVAVVASMAVTGLSACRSAPDVVAYVGSGAQLAKITTDQVDTLYDDAATKSSGPRTGTDGTVAQPTKVSRPEIVSVLIANDVLREYAKEKDLTPAALPADQVAQSVFLDPSAKYVAVYSTYLGYMQAMLAKIKPGTPTQPEVEDLYNRLVAAGLAPAGQVQAWVQQLSQEDQTTIVQRLALKKELAPVAAKLNIDVNPRYDSSFSVLQSHDRKGQALPLIVVPVGNADKAVPVTDAG